MKQNIVTVVLISIAGLVLVAAVVTSAWRQVQLKRAYSRRLLQLRGNLLVKAIGDEYKVDSLIEFEQTKAGNITLEEAMVAAIERWERDNR